MLRGYDAKVVNNDNVEYVHETIFSFDAETNGLWGEPFAIGAVVLRNGKIIDKFVAASQLPNPIPWIKENVLPHCPAPTHETTESLLREFGQFYHKYRNGVTFVSHMGYIVEAYVLRLMRQYGIIDEWEAPFPLHDVASMILQHNEKPKIRFMTGFFDYEKMKNQKYKFDPTSVDAFIEYSQANGETKYSIRPSDIPTEIHNPLYDAWAAGAVFSLLRKGTIEIPCYLAENQIETMNQLIGR